MCWRLYAKRRASLEALCYTLSIDEVYEANLVEDIIEEAEERKRRELERISRK